MTSPGTRRVAMLTPFAFPSPTGNAVTVERIASGLSSRGIEPRVWDLSAAVAATVEREASRWRPALVHAFHAFHAGPLGARVARLLGLPLVVTLTGTDANHDLSDAQRGPTVREVLEGAVAITVFHRSVAARISAARPELAARVVVIAQSVSFRSPDGPPLPRAAGPVMLFPAGIRPVKRPLMPLGPLDAVAARPAFSSPTPRSWPPRPSGSSWMVSCARASARRGARAPSDSVHRPRSTAMSGFSTLWWLLPEWACCVSAPPPRAIS